MNVSSPLTASRLMSSTSCREETPIKGKMIEYRNKRQTSNGTSIPYWRFVGEDNQHALEKKCFNKHAKDYDWARSPTLMKLSSSGWFGRQ
jgi:hypothetical protein